MAREPTANTNCIINMTKWQLKYSLWILWQSAQKSVTIAFSLCPYSVQRRISSFLSLHFHMHTSKMANSKSQLQNNVTWLVGPSLTERSWRETRNTPATTKSYKRVTLTSRLLGPQQQPARWACVLLSRCLCISQGFHSGAGSCRT